MSNIEKVIERQEKKEEQRFLNAYNSANLVADLPEYGAELRFILTGEHSENRIYNRVGSSIDKMAAVLNKFINDMSADVKTELVIASQSMGDFGIRTPEGLIFVFAVLTFLPSFNGKRLSILKLKSCSNQAAMDYKYRFDDVSVILERDHAFEEDETMIF